MIISHKHKFIFIKPMKVAGSSMEVALAKYCSANDIITAVDSYDKSTDDDQYCPLSRNADGFSEHMTAREIRKKIAPEIWNNYYKFTVVRNPWDMAASLFFWNNWVRERLQASSKKGMPIVKKIIKNLFYPRAYFLIFKRITAKNYKEDIKYFLKNFRSDWSNEKYYFNKKGEPICDFYIRYENLEEDYKKICKHLSIPYEKLPQLKTKQRTEKKHYSTYYDEKSKKHIAKICKRENEFFNYKFEQKN